RRYRLWPASRPSAPYLKHHTDCALGGRQYGTSEDIATLQGQNNTSAARLGAVEERSSSLARRDHRSTVKQSRSRCHGRRATWHIPLFGLLKFHSVSLCGRLYPLLRRSTFRFRNVLHLVEARNRVAHVRGIFQRLLALL